MVQSLPIKVSMNSIGEAFTRYQQKLYEIEKLLPNIPNRLSVPSSLATTITITWSYVNQTKLDQIQEVLTAYDMLPMSYPQDFYRIRTDLLYLNYYLCMKDFKLKDQEAVSRQMNAEIKKLNSDFDEMTKILKSPELNALESQREEIEVNIGLVQFYLNRYYNEEDKKRQLINKQINLLGDLVVEAKKNIDAVNGPVKRFKRMSIAVRNHLVQSADYLNEAIKTMIPRA